VGININQPEPGLWWIYLGYLPHGLAFVLILLLTIYLHVSVRYFVERINIVYSDIDARRTKLMISFCWIYTDKDKNVYSHQWANLGFLIDSSKGNNYFPWDLSICSVLTAGGGNCFPILGKFRRSWLLPPIQRDLWDVSYYQLPALTKRTCTESTRCLPEFGPGTESVLQPGSVTTGLVWTHTWPSPKQWI